MNKKTKALTTEQYKEIIQTMREGFSGCRPNERIATALVLEGNLGLRISDILQLHPRDIIRDGDRYRLEIIEQKTGKRRVFTVPLVIQQYIENYCLRHNIRRDDLIFPITERAVQKQLHIVCDYLGFEGISTHSFRKWYATEIYKENGYDYGVFISAANKKYNPSGDTINCDNITVIGASTNNTGNLENDLQRLAYVVKVTREYDAYENYNDNQLPEILAPDGATVVQNPGDIDDGGKGTVDDKGNVTDIETIKNPDVFGTEEVGALGLISWRNELDDMNKRLGELRDSKGEHGVWVRMVRGENDYKSLNSQYNTYQLGYDEKLSTDPHWTLGAAFSYTDGDGGYDTGSFEMDHKTLTLYGSKLNDDGSYIDIVGKYSRLNHDLRNTWGDGEYDANGYSIGVEVGKRFQQGNGFWIEPQAQLTYGHVGSASYNAGDIKVAQDGMESLIGRAGVRFGKDLENGNVYLRASYLYDFDGETGVTFTNAQGRERSFDQDLGGGWCEVGVGTNINLSDATHLYFDIEKTYGGDITTDWKWNAGIRYSF